MRIQVRASSQTKGVERGWKREARAVRAHQTLTPRVTDFFTDFEEKTDCFAVYCVVCWPALKGIWRQKNYGYSIIKDVEFEKAWVAFKSKQKDLKKKGNGGRPNASVPLTEDEVKLIYDKEL